jgi:hypothetical protein
MHFALSLQLRQHQKVSHSTEEYTIPNSLKVRPTMPFTDNVDLYKLSCSRPSNNLHMPLFYRIPQHLIEVTVRSSLW